MDVAGQVIYVISWVNGHLYRYNIGADTLTDLGAVHSSALPLRENSQYPVWDSINNVLLWPRITTFGSDPGEPQAVTLYIYHPNTSTWETDAMYAPDGYRVRGNSAVFDPQQNVLMVMGQRTDPNGKFFLYRYGNGSQLTLKGDVNQDSSVDVLDIQALVNHILGIQDYGTIADVNTDGSVDVLDVQNVVNIILGT